MDATRLVFRAVDRYGAPRPYVTGQVTLSISTGPAVLVGDNPFDFAAAGGVGAVWIRSLPGRQGASLSPPAIRLWAARWLACGFGESGAQAVIRTRPTAVSARLPR